MSKSDKAAILSDKVDAVINEARNNDRKGLTDEQRSILEKVIRKVAIAVVFNDGISKAFKDLEAVYTQIFDDNFKIKTDKGRFLTPKEAAEADLEAIKEANKKIKEERLPHGKKHHPREGRGGKGGGGHDGRE
jgi:hypothetical protein